MQNNEEIANYGAATLICRDPLIEIAQRGFLNYFLTANNKLFKKVAIQFNFT